MSNDNVLKINISIDTFNRLQKETPSEETFDYFINRLLDRYCNSFKAEDGTGCMKLVSEEDVDAFKYEE